MERLRRDIRAAFARHQANLGDVLDAQDRILQRAMSSATTRRRLFPQLAGAAVTLAVGVAVAVVVLLTHGHSALQPPRTTSFAAALAAGEPATMGAGTNNAFVWFTAPITQPAQQPGSFTVTGTKVDVIDWMGGLRYHFSLPQANAQTPTGIQAISIDGRRALLDDGTVIDQTGKVLTHIPALASTMPFGGARWLNDDSGVCVALSNEPQGPTVPTHPKGQGPPIVWPTPYRSLPGADHSVTLKVFGLNGSVRTVATVGTGTLPGPSGAMGDYTAVLTCNRSSEIAVISRIHDADVKDVNPQPGQASSSTNMTVSLWAVKLSTGELLGHTPEARSALGIGVLFGSENGALALERLWNSKQWGADTDAVLHMPSGQAVPVLDVEPIPDTTAISADGTRILRRLVDPSLQKTSLVLIDASDGHIIRRITVNALIGAVAVPEPSGSGFMVQVNEYVAVVDGSGGGSLIHPDIDVAGPLRQQPGMAMTYSQN